MSWDDEQIRYLMTNKETKTYSEIAAAIGKTKSAVRNFVYRNCRTGRDDLWEQWELDLLKDKYGGDKNKPVDLYELAEKLGRSRQNICRKARGLGLTNIKRESTALVCEKMKEVAKERILKHGHPRGMLGKKQTDKSKKATSERSKRLWGDKNSIFWTDEARQRRSDQGLATMAKRMERGENPYSRCKCGKREDLNHFVRSSWEANYERYLKWLQSRGEILRYEYEPDTFWFHEIKRGVRSYLPDFKVWEKNGTVAYHEVKGWMDKKSKTKIARMAKYHPDIKLVVIGSAEYREIQKKVGSFIEHWEFGG